MRIGEIAMKNGLVGGPFGSLLVGSDYVSSGVPVIRGSNMGGRYISGEFVFVTSDKFARDLSRNAAEPGDVIFTQRGTLGQVSLVPESPEKIYVVSQSQMRLRVDSVKANPLYVYYACMCPSFLRQIDEMAVRTGVPHINLGILGKLRIPDKSRREQQVIAEVLGALDDKIAVNSGLCRNMHDLGRAIFDQSAAGRPRVGLNYIVEPCLGGTPARECSECWGGPIPWVSIRDISSAEAGTIIDTAESISAQGSENSRAKVVPKGSVILSSRGTVGLVSRIAMPAAFNQSCYAFRPDSVLPGVLYYSICCAAEASGGVAHGSVFSTITMKSMVDLKAPQFLQPEAQALECRIAPLLDAVESLLRESHALAKLRDTLLPALMDGTMRVKDAVAHVEEVL